ncbi:MAG: gamma-glutamyltransferase, partial [Erythrobacter sp.]|nr:gamma-glutamyltransferase [Erythrobacter sp.]
MLKPIALFSPVALILAGCAANTPPNTMSATPNTAAPSAPERGAVSAADPRATAAGEAILAQGGSATDAAIAVMLALTVVEPQSSGIGGGGFLVHHGQDGPMTFDGRETAPASATPYRFLDQAGSR